MRLYKNSWSLGCDFEITGNLGLSEAGKQRVLAELVSISRESQLPGSSRLLYDAYTWGLDTLAKISIAEIVLSQCTKVEELRQLLKHCAAIGLDSNARRKVLAQAEPQYCDVALVLQYLDADKVPADLNYGNELLRLLANIVSHNKVDDIEPVIAFLLPTLGSYLSKYGADSIEHVRSFLLPTLGSYLSDQDDGQKTAEGKVVSIISLLLSMSN